MQAQLVLAGFHHVPLNELTRNHHSPRWHLELDKDLVKKEVAPLVWPFIVEFRERVSEVGSGSYNMNLPLALSEGMILPRFEAGEAGAA